MHASWHVCGYNRDPHRNIGVYTTLDVDSADEILPALDTVLADCQRAVDCISSMADLTSGIFVSLTPTCHRVEYGNVLYEKRTWESWRLVKGEPTPEQEDILTIAMTRVFLAFPEKIP